MKAQLRLSGGRKLQSPIGLGTRPTTSKVREALINIVGNKLCNSHWLDLFSGSGIIGCEALQRGATRIVAVERDYKTAQICKSNLLKVASSTPAQSCIEVVRNDVLKLLNRGCLSAQLQNHSNYIDPRFDVIYLDPPYESDLYESVLDSLIKGNWLKDDSLVICEHSSEIPLEVGPPWIKKDHRFYGNSSLLIISLPDCPLDDTDSRH